MSTWRRGNTLCHSVLACNHVRIRTSGQQAPSYKLQELCGKACSRKLPKEAEYLQGLASLDEEHICFLIEGLRFDTTAGINAPVTCAAPPVLHCAMLEKHWWCQCSFLADYLRLLDALLFASAVLLIN